MAVNEETLRRRTENYAHTIEAPRRALLELSSGPAAYVFEAYILAYLPQRYGILIQLTFLSSI